MSIEYLTKILVNYEAFKNEEISECDGIGYLDLSEINIFRVKNKFISKDVNGLRNMKNTMSKLETKDYLYTFLIQFKSGNRFLIAVADPVELFEDPYLLAYQQL